jgi:hypothetical protein
MWRTREVVVGAACLVIGSVGQLVQALVTPLGSPEDPVASNLAAGRGGAGWASN